MTATLEWVRERIADLDVDETEYVHQRLRLAVALVARVAAGEVEGAEAREACALVMDQFA